MGCFCSTDNNIILSLATMQNVNEFTLRDTKCDCKVLECYDGDTITIAIVWNKKPYRMKCRLEGIDTPEIRTKNLQEKQRGMEAKHYLSSLIEGKIVKIHCGHWDKYGRLLGTIFYNNENINQHMIEKGYAKAYDGGTKEKFIFDGTE